MKKEVLILSCAIVSNGPPLEICERKVRGHKKEVYNISNEVHEILMQLVGN